MVRAALIITAFVSAHATQACSKSDKAPTPPSSDKPGVVIDAGLVSPVGGGGSGAPSPNERRRGRRSIETGLDGPRPSAFANAPQPPPLRASPTSKALDGPVAASLPDGARRTSRIAMLATHLETMRKLRGGELPPSSKVAVFDKGILRTTYDTKALLNGDGRWLSAKIIDVAPQPNDASTEGAVGVVQARELGWRVVYRYRDDRWVWSEVWRDRP